MSASEAQQQQQRLQQEEKGFSIRDEIQQSSFAPTFRKLGQQNNVQHQHHLDPNAHEARAKSNEVNPADEYVNNAGDDDFVDSDMNFDGAHENPPPAAFSPQAADDDDQQNPLDDEDDGFATTSLTPANAARRHSPPSAQRPVQVPVPSSSSTLAPDAPRVQDHRVVGASGSAAVAFGGGATSLGASQTVDDTQTAATTTTTTFGGATTSNVDALRTNEATPRSHSIAPKSSKNQQNQKPLEPDPRRPSQQQQRQLLQQPRPDSYSDFYHPQQEIADDNPHRQLPRLSSAQTLRRKQDGTVVLPPPPPPPPPPAGAILTIPPDDDHDFVDDANFRPEQQSVHGSNKTKRSQGSSSGRSTPKDRKNKQQQPQQQRQEQLTAGSFRSDDKFHNVVREANDDNNDDNNDDQDHDQQERLDQYASLRHDPLTSISGPQNLVSLDPVAPSNPPAQYSLRHLATDTEILGPLLALHGTMTTVLNGLCVIGPSWRLLLATTVLIVVPFIMLAGGLMKHLASGLVFVDIVFFLLTLGFLAKTAFTDPGFVEKRTGTAIDPHMEQPVTVFWSNHGDQNVDVVFGDDPVPRYPAKQRINALKAADEELNDISMSRDKEDEKKKKMQIKRDVKRKRRLAEIRKKKQEQRKAAAAAERNKNKKSTKKNEDDGNDDDGGEDIGSHHANAEDEDAIDENIEVSDPSSASDSDGDAEKKEEAETVATFRMHVRYCRSCCRYKGLRTFHCDVCKACVDGYDHHCPFTGTCIGHNNYASFMGFMISLQLYIVFVFISAVAGPVDLATRDGVCLREAIEMMGGMSVVLIILIFGLSYGVTGLLILHVYLVFAGKTTMEHLREKYLEIPNPFDRGWQRNLVRALGTKDRAAFTSTFDPLIVAFERQRRAIT